MFAMGTAAAAAPKQQWFPWLPWDLLEDEDSDCAEELGSANGDCQGAGWNCMPSAEVATCEPRPGESRAKGGGPAPGCVALHLNELLQEARSRHFRPAAPTSQRWATEMRPLRLRFPAPSLEPHAAHPELHGAETWEQDTQEPALAAFDLKKRLAQFPPDVPIPSGGIVERGTTAVARQDPCKQLLSLGSLGHPRSCGPACKYIWKPKGCKDGQFCTHCHLCRWSRHR
mmetsp:Transcript_120639/g.336634  ORF Transcript_120639/g.336634 Transcript_120639/m.336634 type:complete len:228 (+) Transcript_120639:50-733(+)